MNPLIQDLVTKQAKRHADKVAVVAGARSMTFGEVEHRSNRLARVLRDAGCRRGDRVCIVTSGLSDAVVGLLAALKADAIVAFLDPATPQERLVEIARACEPVVVLRDSTGRTATAILRRAGVKAVVGALDEDSPTRNAPSADFTWRDAMRVSHQHVASRNRGASPACLVFPRENGSPGVVWTHASIARFLLWAADHFEVTVGDCQPLNVPFSSGWAIYEVLGALVAGATLAQTRADSGSDGRTVARFIRRARLTQWWAPARDLTVVAQADAIGPGDFESLRQVAWWDEEIGEAVLDYWRTRLSHVRFTRFIGGPEGTIASAYYSIPSGVAGRRARSAVGSPSPGCEVMVLDVERRPAGVGEAGEIHVRGFGLSPGYWRRPESKETASATHAEIGGSGRLISTGVLGRRAGDGQIYTLEEGTA